jgi:hypothetical protein
MKVTTCRNIHLHFIKNPIAAFFPLIQKGFYLEIVTDNLQKLLCQTCSLGQEEVKRRIQTIFLNGKPVDDITTATVRSDDCLALSAAMPGLVGATMRSGGVLASFRHSISHRLEDAQSCVQGGVLLIKLFNLLIREIGPRFLKHGILVYSNDLNDFLISQAEMLKNDCAKAQLNAQPIKPDTLISMDWPQKPEFIQLTVSFETRPDNFS